MPWPVHPNGLLGASGDSDSYRIERSLRFNSADLTYLSRTFVTPTSQNIYTLSFWIKRTSFGTIQNILSLSTTSALYFNSSDQLAVTTPSGTASSSAVFRDPSAWYHIVYYQSGTTIILYANGIAVASGSLTSSQFNTAAIHYIGINPTPSQAINGYFAEINFIDGQALTPSSFAETDAITGRWKAKAYSGTYGNNGFLLKFADNSAVTAAALGKDSAGTNNWTPVNFSVATSTLADKVANDSLVDSPTNYGTDTGVGGEVRGNYATLNPISTIRSTILDGALRTNAGDRGSISTIGMTSGKWYCEMYITALGAESSVGLSQGINIMNTIVGSTADSYGYYFNGNKYNSNAGLSYGATYTTGDTIGVAFDASAGTLVFYKNGTSQGTAYSSLTSGPYYFAAEGRSSTSANDVTMNFGQQAWRYAPPTGFKALCTTNLLTPTINKPSNYMDVATYTGTGANQTISVPGFTPDLVWIKSRGAATNHRLYDTTRGTNYLVSNSTAAEVGSGTFAFSGNGFIVSTDSDINSSGTQYVSWAWDAGSSSVTNTSGSISSTVRANPQAGVSIVSFVNASGTNQSTVGHGLGSSPKMIIAKNRDTGANNWAVFHSSVCDTTSKFLQLNTTSALSTFATVWGASLPSSSVFGVTGGGIAAASVNMIAYCFAEIEGFSKFGSYIGNASADGPFIYCGFRPKLIIGKRTDAVENWIIYDTSRDSFNVASAQLQPNTSIAETTANSLIDFNSNGFKFRSTNSFNGNSSGGTHIFAAFAESPFKYARAR
jgi:hypothetical protein